LTGAASLAVLAGGALAVGGQAAFAAEKFTLGSSFGGSGSGSGQFEEPGAVAVEASTGDAFVIDARNERVEKFEPSPGAGGYVAVGEIAPTGTEAFEFKDDPGIAVDNTSDAFAGDVYVASGRGKNEAVYQFEPESGHANVYKATGTRLEGFAEEKIHGVAVGPNGYVYVAFSTSVAIFSPTGEPEDLLAGAASAVQGLAVAGDEVYVATLTGLERLRLNAKYEVEARTVVAVAPTGGEFESVALDGKGRVYVDVVYAKEEGRSAVDVFAANAPAQSLPIAEFGGEGVVQISHGLAYGAPSQVPTVLVSDVTDDEVHVFQHTSPEVTACGATPTSDSAAVACTLDPDALQATWKLAYHVPLAGFVEAMHGTAASEGEVGGELTGLEPAEAYIYRLEASNAGGAAAAEGQFETLPVAPLLFASGASGVRSRSATLNGSVDPEHDAAFYRFEYGQCADAGECATAPFAEETSEAAAGSTRGAVAVSATVGELEPDTTYHYRVVAINGGGETASGEAVFTTGSATQAEVVTGAASDVSQTGAAISGTVDPNGLATTFVWEVGTSLNYGSSIYGSMDAESVPESVGVDLAGLLANTTYHYRLVATNASGTVYGADQTFTTLAYGGEPFTTPVSLALLPVYQQGPPPSPTGAVLPSKEAKPTKAQLLAKALKACKQQRSKGKRVACERQARKKYGAKSTAEK
jgi:hypothetical protein